MIALAGAVLSIVLFLAASWHSPLVLKILIGAWVLAPFVGYVAARRIFPRSAQWLARSIIAITLISIVIYSYAVFGHPTWKAAAPFVVVPVVAWLLIIIAIIAGQASKSSRT